MGNLARILMLTIGTVLFGSEFALGKNPLEHPSWFHLLAGYLVFIVALLGMMGVASLLSRIGKTQKTQKTQSAATSLERGLGEGDQSYPH
jgi:hypothetical protein